MVSKVMYIGALASRRILLLNVGVSSRVFAQNLLLWMTGSAFTGNNTAGQDETISRIAGTSSYSIGKAMDSLII